MHRRAQHTIQFLYSQFRRRESDGLEDFLKVPRVEVRWVCLTKAALLPLLILITSDVTGLAPRARLLA